MDFAGIKKPNRSQDKGSGEEQHMYECSQVDKEEKIKNYFKEFNLEGLDQTWEEFFRQEFREEYFMSLMDFVEKKYENARVYPPKNRVFQAFKTIPFHEVKVVILGQDPYHGEGQANGLSFSVNKGIKSPPSLLNIFKELELEYGVKRENSDLSDWAKQGVLLLNSVLTVDASLAGSHGNKGWEIFTSHVVDFLDKSKQGLVFILWGNYAISKAKNVDEQKHLILKSPHPSPLSSHRGFFGNNHFAKANDYLLSRGVTPIDWINEEKNY